MPEGDLIICGEYFFLSSFQSTVSDVVQPTFTKAFQIIWLVSCNRSVIKTFFKEEVLPKLNEGLKTAGIFTARRDKS